jgi:hypothetical protein
MSGSGTISPAGRTPRGSGILPGIAQRLVGLAHIAARQRRHDEEAGVQP